MLQFLPQCPGLLPGPELWQPLPWLPGLEELEPGQLVVTVVVGLLIMSAVYLGIENKVIVLNVAI